MQFILGLLSNHNIVAVVVMVATCLNVVLTAIKQVIVTITPDPAKQAASPVLSFIGTALGIVGKILDFLSANPAH